MNILLLHKKLYILKIISPVMTFYKYYYYFCTK